MGSYLRAEVESQRFLLEISTAAEASKGFVDLSLLRRLQAC